MNQLEIKDLHATIADQEIIRGLSLTVPKGEVHAIMGPNGSGKSTLAKVIAGHPDYTVTGGSVLMDGEDILALEPDERARRGMFLAFQYPNEIPGVTIANFLRAAVQARLPEGEELEATDYYAKLYEKMDMLEMDRTFTSRAVNEGFSGGEKKRNEILQLAMLEPKYAVLDETDSGLDIDALKVVANGVNSLRGPNLGVLLDHALSAAARLHCARSRARDGEGRDRPQRRQEFGVGIGRKRLRMGARGSRGTGRRLRRKIMVKQVSPTRNRTERRQFLLSGNARERRRRRPHGRHDPLHLEHQGRPGLGAPIPPQRLQDFPEQTDADALGEQGSGSDRLRKHPLLPEQRDAAEAQLGRRAG